MIRSAVAEYVARQDPTHELPPIVGAFASGDSAGSERFEELLDDLGRIVIVVDSSAVYALMDRSDAHHEVIRDIYEATGTEWVLPVAVIPEVHHVVRKRMGSSAGRAFLAHVQAGSLPVEAAGDTDVHRAVGLDAQYSGLDFGFADGLVMALAERKRARAILTLDLRDFGSVQLEGGPEIWPRDYRA